MDKSLQDKAIDFKGKKYVLVADRVLYFNENYKNGSITTELLSKPDDYMVVIKATVTFKEEPTHSYICEVSKYIKGETTYTNMPQCTCGELPVARTYTAHSQATWGEGYINKTSALENAETSAVGRALAFMGIGVLDSIASADEINKAQTQPAKTMKQKYADDAKQAVEDFNKGKDPF